MSVMTIDAHEGIIRNANAEIERLASLLRGLEQRLPEIASEIAALADERTRRVEQLKESRRILVMAQTSESQAQAKARLAQNTLAEEATISELRKAKQACQNQERVLHKLEQEAASADTQADARLTALTSEQDAASERIAHYQQELEQVEQVRRQAKAEQGEQAYQAICTRKEQLEQEIAASRTALLEKQLELKDYLLDEALPGIAAWPDYDMKIKELIPVNDDSVSVALAAFVAYADALLADGRAITALGTSVLHTLAVPVDELYSYERLDTNPTRLRARREQVARLLKSYIRNRRDQLQP